MRKIITDVLVLVAVVLLIMFVYERYGEQIIGYFYAEDLVTMYAESVPLAVSIADSNAERKQGLSGVKSLGEFEGMLFVFDSEDYYGMWMKDMHIPLDMIWIGNDLRIVHIEENVKPETYPKTFSSDVPARFVLEVNAFFARNANVVVGDTVTLPPSAVPVDLVHILQ